jgi:predicted permease
MGFLARDLLTGARALLRRPRSSAFSLAVLALGIGVPTAMFGVLDGVMLRGLPFPEGDRIVTLTTGGGYDRPMPVADFRALRDGGGGEGAFSAVAAFRTFNTVVTREGAGSEGLIASYVTSNLFHLLGVEPALGRGFTLEDEAPAAPAVVLLSHGVWRARFAGDPAVLGETVIVNREPMTVVGVMPEGFGFPVRHDAWAALKWQGRLWSGEPVFAVGRLRPGLGPEEAEAELAPVAARLDEERPLGTGADVTGSERAAREVHVRRYTEALLPPEVQRSLKLLLWAALGVLLVACANGAGLRLGDALARRHDLAVRRAVGAGAGQLLRLHLAEAVVLVAASAAAGLGLAWLLVRLASLYLLQGSMLVRQFWIDVRLDLRSCLFAVAVAAVSVVLAGLAPALWSLRGADLRLSGSAAAGRSSEARGGLRLAGALVVAQIALCFALVSGSGLLVKSGLALLAEEPAYDPRGLLRVLVSGYQAELDEPEARRAFWQALLPRLEAAPEIAGVAVANGVPWSGRGAPTVPVRTGPADGREPDGLPRAGLFRVSPGFFETLGLPILAGRLLDAGDDPAPGSAGEGAPGPELPVVVSASFARRHFAGSPLGAPFELLSPFGDGEPLRARVVGVAADQGLGRSDEPYSEDAVYAPFSTSRSAGGFLVARGRGGKAGVVRAIDREIAGVEPRVATLDEATFEEDRAEETWVERRLAGLVSVFAAIALALCAAGLFGVVTLALQRRTRELAIRSALGAVPRELGALLLRTGAAHVSAGLAAGAGLAWAAHRSVQGFLYQVEPWDPLVTAGAAAGVVAVLLAAVLGPVTRAARTDPAEVLASD